MAMLDIIEYVDPTGEELVHRVPEQGSAETKYGSQLIVRENQMAVFFRDGKGMDVLGPGRHTLSTQNLPILTGLLKKIAGFGPNSPFRTEVMFVNMKVFTNLKWGTKEPVAFRDKELGIVRLRAFGNFTMQVKEPLLVINNLVGGMGRYETDDVQRYLKDVIVARFNDVLGERVESVFDLPQSYDELAFHLKTDRLEPDFTQYGLELRDFFIQAITPPEEVQKMIDERSSMAAVGDMNKFMQFQAAKSMRDAARGEGGGGAAAAGMGIGVGAGMGMMMPGMMAQAMGGMMNPGQAQGQTQGAGTAAAGASGAAAGAVAAIACPKCQGSVPAGSKFCPSCGEKMAEELKCPNCGAAVLSTNKFCGNCGFNLLEKPKCKNCQAELEPGAKFCPNCGQKTE